MDLSTLRQIPHLSASSIGEYVACSLAYKFGKIDKIPFEKRPDALEFGTVIHAVLEAYYQEKMIGELMPLKDILANFEDCWRETAEDNDDIEYSAGKDFNTYLMLGKDMLTVWHNKLPEDEYTIIGIEQPFSFTLPEVPLPIIGAIDLIEEDKDGTIIITDFKTAGRAYSASEVNRNFQLTIYDLAIKHTGFRNRETVLKFDTLIKTQKPKFQQYFSSRTATDHQRAIRKIQAVWDGISKGVFIPNNEDWRCPNCQFKQACDEWFLSKKEAA